ncbi:MAG: DUF1295 domain-containing protein [Clostridia bacterium]|nr:DUF1295 domain-containing protein [Clostridia bacterium]
MMSAFPEGVWILLAVSAVFCAIGFKKTVWFLSIGYGMSTAALGAALLIMGLSRGACGIAYIAQCVLLVVYGFRLGGFILIRELKNANYRKKIDAEFDPKKKTPVFVNAAIWITVAFLYFMETSPVFYRLANGHAAAADACEWIGLMISVIGVTLETLADKQKSAQKKVNPNAPAMKGLYKMCRCPNYFGEIVFWTGVFVSGLSILGGWQWLIAGLGWVCIVYVMFNGAQRLEKRQNKNYGGMAEYRAYADKTPIIIPLLPVYHLVKEEKK